VTEGFLNFLFISLAVFLLGLMGVQGLRRTVPLVSVRNLFFVGFIVFQLTSASISLVTQRFKLFMVTDLRGSATTLWVLCALFVVVFLIASRWTWPVRQLLARIPDRAAFPNFVSLAVLSTAFLGTGILFKNILIYIPVFGPLSAIIGSGLLAAAVGLAAWAYAPRLLNPAALALMMGVLITALLSSMHLSYGRRDLLTVLVAAIWGAYHGHWRHLSRGREIMMLAAVGMAGILLIAAVTATRGKQLGATDLYSRITSLESERIEKGLVATFTGQETARNSMWIIENIPENHDYRPFNMLIYAVTQPIPRIIWPGKPNGLGWAIVHDYTDVGRRMKGFSIGPGVIGHIWADNPWLTFLPYTIIFGLLCRTMDEVILRRPYNPFIVVAFGAALGQVIGLARGDTGLFLFRIFAAVFFTLMAMFFVTKTLRLFGWSAEYEVADWADDYEWEDEAAWDDQAVLDHAADDQWRYEGHEADDRY